MQVWDQVKVKKEGDEHLGRAGVVNAVAGPDDATQVVSVNLDETPTHEAGVVDFAAGDLEFLGR
ncbi:MAG: hypothetical protein ACJ8LG_21600 [Massilia sp.]